jgi:hypothetical protein
MRKAKTYFEQIPIETVKKIAEAEESDKKEIENPNVIVETPATKTEPYGVTGVMYCRNRA